MHPVFILKLQPACSCMVLRGLGPTPAACCTDSTLLRLRAASAQTSRGGPSWQCALADHGVLLGAGVSVLGPIHVGAGAKVGAGSVVVTDLPNHSVAVGVPAKIIRYNCPREPSMDMDAVADFKHDYQI